jgi:predicted TPR repeat methyltransferase
MSGDDPTEGDRLLQRAYSLGAPDSHVDFYRDFADTYDSAFAADLGYIYPLGVVSVLAGVERPRGAILDIGCGTGLVATAIRKVDPAAVIDGVDISPDMLEKARSKGDYRHLMEADLTADFSQVPTDYAAIVSAGLFTFGHLGPDVIPDMVSLCSPGAVAALGVNSKFFVEQGFQDVLDALDADGRIASAALHEVPIYDGRDEAHANETGMILRFAVL